MLAGGEADPRPIRMPHASMSCGMSSKMASCCCPLQHSVKQMGNVVCCEKTFD